MPTVPDVAHQTTAATNPATNHAGSGRAGRADKPFAAYPVGTCATAIDSVWRV